MPGVRRAARTGTAERDAFLTALAGGGAPKKAGGGAKWDVLADDYEVRAGGGTKLKDWAARDAGAAAGPVADRLDGSSDSEDAGGDLEDDEGEEGEEGDPLAGGGGAASSGEEEEAEEEGGW
jgi:cobalamin biosynthesis protein CobT